MQLNEHIDPTFLRLMPLDELLRIKSFWQLPITMAEVSLHTCHQEGSMS